MNENSQSKTPTLDSWLDKATLTLKNAGIESARLDAELILAHTIRKPRTYIHAHSDKELTDRHRSIADARLELRLENTPVAYIVGHKEFYGRRFKTTPAALIPRPESETMIDLLGELLPRNLSLLPEKLHLVDIGTGTGCLGITAKLEWPEIDVTLTDISTHALYLAKDNARLLDAAVHFAKNDLLHGWTLPIDIILANLPYVDREWQVSPETRAEPEQALYADEGGLAIIKKLLQQSVVLLKPKAIVLLEADPRQNHELVALAKSHGLHHIRTDGFISAFSKSG